MMNLHEIIDYESKKRVEMLKKRTKRCVCKYCGGKLKLKRIIFSQHEEGRIEIFCDHCDRLEFGIEKEIYQSARYFVEKSAFTCYPELEDNEQTKMMTIAKVAEIMAWQDQNLGFLDEDGFTVPLQMNQNFVGECITISEDDLEELENEIENKYALDY